MSRFLENASRIFEAAEASARAGHDVSDWTILVGADGGISLVADSDWSLESIQAHRGAQMVFRVRQQADRVLVQGRAGSRTCVFETEKPNGAARRLLAAQPCYAAFTSTVTRPPAGRRPLLPAASG